MLIITLLKVLVEMDNICVWSKYPHPLSNINIRYFWQIIFTIHIPYTSLSDTHLSEYILYLLISRSLKTRVTLF